MASVSSNIDEVAAALDALIDGFDFTRPGKDQSLGRDMAGVAARGIIDRSVPGCKAPDGSDWAENEEHYADAKRAKYDADQAGIRTGQMLSLRSVLGEVTVTRDQVVMRYGTGEAPKSAANGAELTDSDKARTDREKAGYFTEKVGEFYGLDATIAGELTAEARDALHSYLRG
jgi:hypothetical protein